MAKDATKAVAIGKLEKGGILQRKKAVDPEMLSESITVQILEK